MSSLSEPLLRMCEQLPGTVSATIMGLDGLPVETHEPGLEAPAQELEVNALLVEYSSLVNQAKQSTEMFAAGKLEELSIRAQHLSMLIRPITSEYVLTLAILPHASHGKARYLLRVFAPKLVDELS